MVVRYTFSGTVLNVFKTREFGSKLPGKETERNTTGYIIFIVQLRQRILTHGVEAAVAKIWNQMGIYNTTPHREDIEGSQGPSLTVYKALLNPFGWRALYKVAQKLTVRHQFLSKASVYVPTWGGGINVTLEFLHLQGPSLSLLPRLCQENTLTRTQAGGR